jgi:hypothetical protein
MPLTPPIHQMNPVLNDSSYLDELLSAIDQIPSESDFDRERLLTTYTFPLPELLALVRSFIFLILLFVSFSQSFEFGIR